MDKFKEFSKKTDLKYQLQLGMTNLNYLIDHVTEVVLVHCSVVDNDYQQDSRVLYMFVPNKSFGLLLEISPKMLIFLKASNSRFS